MTNDDGRPEAPLTTTYVAAPKPSDGPQDDDGLVLPPRAPRMSRNTMVGAGVAGAVVLGVLLGVVLGPTVKSERAPAKAAERTAATDGVQIEVTRRQAPPAKVAMNVGKMDAAGTVIQPVGAVPVSQPAAPEPERERRGLLGRLAGIFGIGGNDDAPEPVARPAPRPVPTPPPAPVEQVRVLRSDPEAEARPVPVAEREDPDFEGEAPAYEREGPAYQREEAGPPRRMARPSFDCRYARSRSEQMVCSDPGLAAADRRLARAFRQAVDNGAPYDRLRAQQNRWLAARERAAVSPAAVGMVYEQRIAELERMSGEDGW
jgi:uncharacterized protein YecT (DUF1311 family)